MSTKEALQLNSERAHRFATQYLAVWDELDDIRRHTLIAALFSHDVNYVDPMMQSSGHDGLDKMIAAVQTQFPGFHFQLNGTPDGYGNIIRFSWKLVTPDGAPVAFGTDVVTIADDERINTITGFLDVTVVAA